MLATQSSMVLLQNNGSLLPLTPGKRIAVIGPHGNATTAMVSNVVAVQFREWTISLCFVP